MSDELSLGEHRFTSRLVVGTGKYKDFPTMQKAIVASGAQMVTVAVRRLDLQAQGEKSLLHWIPKECVLLPNTAGCFSADEAIRTLRLARELEIGGPKPLVKLEVLSDQKTPLRDGDCHEAGDRGGTPRVPRWAHPAQAVRQRVQPADRPHLTCGGRGGPHLSDHGSQRRPRRGGSGRRGALGPAHRDGGGAAARE